MEMNRADLAGVNERLRSIEGTLQGFGSQLSQIGAKVDGLATWRAVLEEQTKRFLADLESVKLRCERQDHRIEDMKTIHEKRIDDLKADHADRINKLTNEISNAKVRLSTVAWMASVVGGVLGFLLSVFRGKLGL